MGTASGQSLVKAKILNWGKTHFTLSVRCHHQDIARKCLDFASFAIQTYLLSSWDFGHLVDSILACGGHRPETVDQD